MLLDKIYKNMVNKLRETRQEDELMVSRYFFNELSEDMVQY